MSMNEDIKKTCITFCAKNELRVAHAVELFYEMRKDLNWDYDTAASEEIKSTLVGMQAQKEDLYGLSNEILNEWISAL